MLTVTKLGNAEYLIGSVALGVEEYYLGVGEAPGVWAGRWATELGLEGVVEADDLRSLIEGRHPITGADLVAKQRDREVRAIDLTFSAPKSVSVLWALGSDDVHSVVMGAHRDAVGAALGFLEARASVARRQVAGVRSLVATEGLAVAGFVHRTSREGDPQVHSHSLAVNLTRRVDGRVVALDARPLFVWARAAGSVYQAELQRALTARLGVAWGPDRRGTREIDGFTRDELRVFSKRTTQIEAELAAVGADQLTGGLRARADDAASLATRVAKDKGLTPARLVGRWEAEAADAGLAVGRDLDERVCFGERTARPLGYEQVTTVLLHPESGVCGHSPRFTAADVVEHVCALAAGRLTLAEIEGHVDRFLASDLVVRLTPTGDEPGVRLAEWSTVAHRHLEDRVLGLLDTLAAAGRDPLPAAVVVAAVDARPWLGEDQREAVEVLTGPGAAVRCVLAPAGFGKTAMVATAARAAAEAGRPVVGTATTAKAVAELDGAGVGGVTVAGLRARLNGDGLASGTVVVLDEVSQCSTRDAETVLAAVAACPGGQLWVLGDARQAQSVLAGGVADELERRAAAGRVPAAVLDVNRRQVDADDRAALGLLRSGRADESQAVRADHGWEHTECSPEATREALAAAAAGDIGRHGPAQVAVLCVSHVDAEDLADRVRRHLTDAGSITGPGLEGPGWAGPRSFQAGDRVLFHTRCGSRADGIINGTTATVTRAGPDGLDVRPDDTSKVVHVDAGFVTGTRVDGSPRLSHAWARTVDGAQGGTWEVAHLLGSPALDQYRGYVGQSRSRQPTHTWNTTPVRTLDHGGEIVDDRTPGEAVAVALARTPERSMAAVSDPHLLDRDIRTQIAEHLDVWDHRPPDRTAELAAAVNRLRQAEQQHAGAAAYHHGCTDRRDDLGPLAVLRAAGRADRDRLDQDLSRAANRLQDTTDQVTDARGEVSWLTHQQQAADRFVATEGWRPDEVHRLREQLAQHWAVTEVACVRAGDPLAHGTDRLRGAAHHRQDQLAALDTHLPADRTTDLDRATRQLDQAIARRHQAAERLTTARDRLEHAPRRKRDVAAADVDRRLAELRARTSSERDLHVTIGCLADHQRQRNAVLVEQHPVRGQLLAEETLLSRALDETLTERVIALAGDPPPHLRAQLGPVPANEAGRAVWCHHAARHETNLDHPTPDGHLAGLRLLRSHPRQEIALAAQAAPDLRRSDTLEAWAAVTAEIRPLLTQHELQRHEHALNAETYRSPDRGISPSL